MLLRLILPTELSFPYSAAEILEPVHRIYQQISYSQSEKSATASDQMLIAMSLQQNDEDAVQSAYHIEKSRFSIISHMNSSEKQRLFLIWIAGIFFLG